tara:strand:+ start:54 stop:443 length:390 start_codon:yes stop_codon:yes gene_type:complete
MKISVLSSTLSCISKCIRFVVAMINKKIIVGLFLLSFLGACASPTAMLGPVYSFSSTGSIYHAGLSYGSNELITKHTGKTPFENLKEISVKDQAENNNIRKKTLESDDFYNLVKNKIKVTGSLIKNSTQ